MVIELRVVQFWSEIILVISNRTRAARSFDYGIMRMISDQIALHSVQLPLINLSICLCTFAGFVESHSHIFPIEEGEYDHEYDEVPSDEETADKDSTPEV